MSVIFFRVESFITRDQAPKSTSGMSKSRDMSKNSLLFDEDV